MIILAGEPTERERLADHAIRPRKRLGQNFLLDPGIPREIVRRASWPEHAPVCEIGPGAGALTAALLASGRRVTAVELDPALAALVRERFASETARGSFTLHEADFLDFDLARLRELNRRSASDGAGEPGREDADRGVAGGTAAGDAGIGRPGGGRTLWLAGNLPYAVTTAMVRKALTCSSTLAGAVFMVQREYGERILARAGEDAYGSLSVWVAAHARARGILRVGASAFWPRPAVDSMVVELLFPDPPPFAGDRASLERVLRAAFGQRRKMLENSLAHGLGLDKGTARRLLIRAGCDPAARGETLPLERFAALVEGLREREGDETSG